MKIQALVCSHDRAMQLDAALRSFFLHCQDGEAAHIYVIYKVSNEEHHNQYETLRTSYPAVTFVNQKYFRHDIWGIVAASSPRETTKRTFWLIDFINSIGSFLETLPGRVLRNASKRLRKFFVQKLFPSIADDSFFLFLVDDNIFVQDFSLGLLTQTLQEQPSALGISLRLGRNTTYSYPRNRTLSLPEFSVLPNRLLLFQWTNSDGEFAYPLEISSSIYRAADIVPLVMRLTFTNPNELEYQMAVRVGEYSDRMPNLICAKHSLTFCNPVNIVQSFAPNRAGEKAGYSSSQLAKLFYQGYRVQVEAYDGFSPESCHQEVDLSFINVWGDLTGRLE